MHPIFFLIDTVLLLYQWVLIIYIILGWLIYFKVVNAYQPFVQKVHEVLFRLTEPVLKRVRKFSPNLNGIDISPIIVFLIIIFIRYTLRYYA